MYDVSMMEETCSQVFSYVTQTHGCRSIKRALDTAGRKTPHRCYICDRVWCKSFALFAGC